MFKLDPMMLCKMICSLFLIFAGLASAEELPQGPGRPLVVGKCVGCHDMGVITGLRASREDWEASVDRMTARGVWLSDEEFDRIVDYLASHFGLQPVNVNKASAEELQVRLALTSIEAMAIVRHRDRNGRFKDWQEVSKVEGVPTEKISRARDRLTF